MVSTQRITSGTKCSVFQKHFKMSGASSSEDFPLGVNAAALRKRGGSRISLASNSSRGSGRYDQLLKELFFCTPIFTLLQLDSIGQYLDF